MRSGGGYHDADLQKGIGQRIGQRGLGDYIAKLHAQMHHRQGNLWTDTADNALCPHQFRGQNHIQQMLSNLRIHIGHARNVYNGYTAAGSEDALQNVFLDHQGAGAIEHTHERHGQDTFPELYNGRGEIGV